jgi:pyrroloquinoline quinone biosynthesis protein E
MNSVDLEAQSSAVQILKRAPRPFGLLAELTYRCPLHCPYCSNPTKYPTSTAEMTTSEWLRTLEEAAELGVTHVLFSGGEPLLFPDLQQLVAYAREVGLYTNLITSAVGLTQERAETLKAAGLDSVQISFQADERGLANAIAGASAHELKLKAARCVRELGFPLTINVVLHRGNISLIASIIALAEELGAERLELANTQFYGWAFRNKSYLLPTRTQVEEADQISLEAKKRLQGKMEILYVLPDYYGERPKPCMNGWGQRYLTVNPVGDVLPCPTASEIPNLKFDSMREHSLRWIWEESEAFNCFRGTDWMREPCRTCEWRDRDFGGCRCQAALLTGDATNADPVCSLSPHHDRIVTLIDAVSADASNAGVESRDTLDVQRLSFRLNPQ